ncbi:unnamed protein product, partial [Boreogadus saida]
RDEGSFRRKTPPLCPSSKGSQAELLTRRSARRPRPTAQRSQVNHALPVQDPNTTSTLYGHTPECEPTCLVWHVDLRIRNPKLSPRLLELSRPKTTHPHFQSKRQVFEKGTSETSRAQSKSPRLDYLSLPRLRLSQVCYQPSRPEEPIRTVRDLV